MSFKKIFSHDNDTNFNDYLKNKKGKEILKNIKSKYQNTNTNTNSTIDKFVSYEERRLLTRTYYNYLNYEDKHNIAKINILHPTSLNNGQTSFIICEKIKDHLHMCSECFKESEYQNNCTELKRILYPYGFYSNSNSNSNNTSNSSNNNNNNTSNSNSNKIDLSKYLNHTILPVFSQKTQEQEQEKEKEKEQEQEQIKINKTEMYPTITKFIFEPEKNIDYFKKQSKMNAYSVYPHIITNKNIENTPVKENYYHYPSNFYNNFDQFINQNTNIHVPSFNLPVGKDTKDDKSDFTNTNIQTRIIPERNIIDIAVLSQEYSNK